MLRRLRARTITLVVIMPLLLLVVGSCGNSESLTAFPENVTFMAGYKPQANLPFAAVYVAERKGFFGEQGLDVSIRHSTGQHVQLLLEGEVQITTADASYVLKRRSDPGIPIVSVALFGQKGQQGFAVLEKSGIKTISDWEGKIFGYKISVPPEYLAILAASGTPRSSVKEVGVGFDPRVLSNGRVDILAVFKSNEPDLLNRIGHPVKVFDPEDYGVPTMGLTYIVSEEFLGKQGAVLERFLKGAMMGVEFILQNEEEALDIIMEFAPQANREHQKFMLREEVRNSRSSQTETQGLGSMSDDQWGKLYLNLLKYGALKTPFDYHQAYDKTPINNIYEGSTLNWP